MAERPRAQFLETYLLIGAGIGAVVIYLLYGDRISAVVRQAYNGVKNFGVNALTGELTSDQINTVAMQAGNDVAKAGGNATDVLAAEQQVANFALWSRRLDIDNSWLTNSLWVTSPILANYLQAGSIPSTFIVYGTGGMSIYDLRAVGYNDDQIRLIITDTLSSMSWWERFKYQVGG